MAVSETVGATVTQQIDPLTSKLKRDVQSMRSALMLCNTSDVNSVRAAMNNILVLRIYHQIGRIIQYTEMIDKIQDKLYSSINISIESMMDGDPRTWMTLLNIAERLQKLMVESHKLLEPYLSMESLSYIEVSPDVSADSFAKNLLDQESRERLRSGAQAILAALEASPAVSDSTSVSEE